jgi:hypothetical protein
LAAVNSWPVFVVKSASQRESFPNAPLRECAEQVPSNPVNPWAALVNRYEIKAEMGPGA